MESDFNRQFSLLNQAIIKAVQTDSEHEIVKDFCHVIINLLNADYGFSFFKDKNEKEFKLIYKDPRTPYEPPPPRTTGVTRTAFEDRLPVFTSDYSQSPWLIEELEPFLKGFVSIPITYQSDNYGTFNICYFDVHEFSDEEKSLCVFIGNAAAHAITIHRLLRSEKKARREAEMQEARFRALIENSNDAILLIDAEGNILDASPSVLKMAGYEPTFLLGKNMVEFIHPDFLETIGEHMQNTLQNPDKAYTVEFQYRHFDGSWRWMESTGVNMLSQEGVESIVANIRDTTQRKTSEDTIRHQAYHDSLTGLPNREEMAVRMDQALETAKRHGKMLAVMFVDMDRFKHYNDNLGHSVGDTVLKVAASRIQASLRSEDTVSRFGGDEFVILLNEVGSAKEAVIVAEKILKAVSLPVQIGDHVLKPTMSIGVAVYPEDGSDGDTLKKRADIALYRAKQKGKNRYQLYDNSMESYESERFNLENALRRALEEEQIILYYQPIVSLKRKQVIAVEALARWQHPTRGLLLPGEFIPLAEETGQIGVLGDYVLRLALRQVKAWQAAKMPNFRMAVNLSSQQFAEADFVSKLDQLFKEYRVEPSCLDLEVTESLAMGNLDLTAANLKQLKKMGVHITIDDFGTGYSSLSYLKRFPINNLKIDRSFVRHSITNSQDASIVRTIISMAHNLNLRVIAEGVETDQQLSFLESLGCNAAQGFYLAHPMPADELAAWLLEKKFAKPAETSLIFPLKDLGKKIFSRN